MYKYMHWNVESIYYPSEDVSDALKLSQYDSAKMSRNWKTQNYTLQNKVMQKIK